MIYTAALGTLFVYSAVLALVREFWSRPEQVKYPRLPGWVRGLVVIYALVFLAIGLSALLSLLGPRVWPVSDYFVLAALVTAFHNTTLLIQTMRQGYGPRVHSRIEQIKSLAECTPEQRAVRYSATQEAYQRGFTVAAPEGALVNRDDHPPV